MKKLVRDRIPEIIANNGEDPIVRTLGKKEFKDALKVKLIEEVSEVAKSLSKKQLIEELADVQEVMRSMYDAFGIECGDVTTCARKKRKERGGFSKRIYLEGVR